MSPNHSQRRIEGRQAKAGESLASRLESLEASVKVVQRDKDAIPKLAAVLLAGTPAERAAVKGAMLAAQGWLESARRAIEISSADFTSARHVARLEALRVETLELKLILAERAERMHAIWGAPGGCPERAPVLPASELAELTRSMTELREAFWAKLYSFPVAYTGRLEVLSRIVVGELGTDLTIFRKPTDGRSQRALLSEAKALLKSCGFDRSGGLRAPQGYSSSIGEALARLPDLPEPALELSTIVEQMAHRFCEPKTDGGTNVSDAAIELGGDVAESSNRVAALLSAKNSYLTLKSYLFAANRLWAEKLAARRALNVPPAHRPDVSQGAYIGLLKGIERWDPSADAGFTAFTAAWIVQSIGLETRRSLSSIAMPSGVAPLFNYLRRLSDAEAREADVDQIARNHSVSADVVRAARAASRTMVSLSHTRTSNGWERAELAASIADARSVASDEALIAGESRERAEHLVRKLPAREQLVLRLKFGLDDDGTSLNLREVGDRLGLSRERVRQIERRALLRLRTYLERTPEAGD